MEFGPSERFVVMTGCPAGACSVGTAGDTEVGSGRGSAPESAGDQGTLFDDPAAPPADGQLIGYRGPTACSAAGITYRQLDYWARTGLVVPSIRSATGSGSQRLYSFKDILVLKVVKRLLDTGVSLQNIRTAVDHLRERGADDLAGHHAALRRRHGLRVPLLRGGRRPASRRPGRLRHRRQRRVARAGRIAGPPARRACRRRRTRRTALGEADDELARRRQQRTATA